jgi:hypothetical protein
LRPGGQVRGSLSQDRRQLGGAGPDLTAAPHIRQHRTDHPQPHDRRGYPGPTAGGERAALLAPNASGDAAPKSASNFLGVAAIAHFLKAMSTV